MLRSSVLSSKESVQQAQRPIAAAVVAESEPLWRYSEEEFQRTMREDRQWDAQHDGGRHK